MIKLLNGVEALGLKLTKDQADSFAVYYKEMVQWNERTNLTAITDYEEVQCKHFVDSLSVVKSKFVTDRLRTWCPQAFAEVGAGTVETTEASTSATSMRKDHTLTLLDIGSGAGFPGIPLNILCPSLRLTLLDSVGKKTAFLAHIVQALGLHDVTILTGRAEDFGKELRFREQFDIVTARAVAALATLSEYALPFCSIGGIFVAMKKAGISGEIEAAQKAIHTLGGRIVEQVSLPQENSEEEKILVVIEKASATPTGFPRRPNLPLKHPL